MEKSNIHKKLLQFQKMNISVMKDGNNPHFKSKYATLNEVLDKVKKPLNDLGVVIIFEPNIEGLQTILHCVDSGTEVKGFMKYVDCGNAQKLLACNTYYRRGTLVSLLGLEDEDDDGNKASVPTPVIKTPAPARPDEVLITVSNDLKACKDLKELQDVYTGLTPNYQKLTANLKNELKAKLK
jgi:hypothetical protein